jgi:hypothetical protein
MIFFGIISRTPGAILVSRACRSVKIAAALGLLLLALGKLPVGQLLRPRDNELLSLGGEVDLAAFDRAGARWRWLCPPNLFRTGHERRLDRRCVRLDAGLDARRGVPGVSHRPIGHRDDRSVLSIVDGVAVAPIFEGHKAAVCLGVAPLFFDDYRSGFIPFAARMLCAALVNLAAFERAGAA